MKPYLIIPEDFKKTDSVLFNIYPPDPRLQLRETYRDLACPSCGRVDERKALKRGIEGGIDFPKKTPDLFPSCDDFYIVSQRMRDFLSKFGDARIDYYSFPSDPRVFVGIPETLFFIKRNDTAFDCEGFCSRCRRVGAAAWGTTLFDLPEDLTLAAFWFEKGRNAAPIWVCSEALMQALKKSGLKG